MRIGGFQKFSLIDYPGKICAIIFTQGCNFRCPYCHNPELVIPEKFEKPIPEKDVFSFLKTRIGKLDAVEITGGEPTLQPDLIDVIKKIKKMGFLVKLDSNGSNPKILKKILDSGLVDYVAMDVKTSLPKYKKVGAGDKINQIQESIEIIKNKAKDYEFRTTVVPKIVDKNDIKEITKNLKGVKRFILQQFRNTEGESSRKVLDNSFAKIKPYQKSELKEMADILRKTIKNVELRI